MSVAKKKARAKNATYKLVRTKSPFHSIAKHPRYLSDWADDTLVFDVSMELDGSRISKWRLADFWLPPNKVYSTTTRLIDHRHLVDSIKAYFNNVMTYYFCSGKSGLETKVRHKSMVSMLLEWMWLNNMFSFGDLTAENIKPLIEVYAISGRAGLLQRDCRYQELIDNYDLSDVVTVRKNGRKGFKIIGTPEAALLGINICRAHRPVFFLEAVYAAHDKSFIAGDVEDKELISAPSVISIAQLLQMLKTFYVEVPKGFDRPSSPLINTANCEAMAKKLCKKTAGRTSNLPIDQFAALTQEGLTWIYQYSKGILVALDEICDIARMDASDSTRSNYFKTWYKECWPAIVKAHGIPFSTLQGINGFMPSLRGNQVYDPAGVTFVKLIKYLASACFTLIAIMNARRRDEVKGADVGLYFGCLDEIKEPHTAYICTMYIEKTVKDFVPIETNRVTADAVRVLERLVAISQPSAVPAIIPSERSINLFRIPSPSSGGIRFNNLEVKSVKEYLKYACRDVNGVINTKTHTFRRIASILYMYRFEHPSLLAVSDMLFHNNIATTKTYITDTDSLSAKQRIEELWPKEVAIMERDMGWAREEWLFDHVDALMSGRQQASGGFPKLVRRFIKILGKSVRFTLDDDESLSRKVARQMINKGHSPKPDRHGNCMVPNNRKVTTAPRCYDAESNSLKKERANASLCGTCPYHWRPEGNLVTLRKDLNVLERQSLNVDLPIFERKRAERGANNLRAAIQLSEEQQEKYSKEFHILNHDIQTWKREQEKNSKKNS